MKLEEGRNFGKDSITFTISDMELVELPQAAIEALHENYRAASSISEKLTVLAMMAAMLEQVETKDG